MTVSESIEHLAEEIAENPDWDSVVLKRDPEEGITPLLIFEVAADHEARKVHLLTEEYSPTPRSEEEALDVAELGAQLRAMEQSCGGFQLCSSSLVVAVDEEGQPSEVPIVGVAANGEACAFAFLQAPLEQWADLFD